MTATPSAPARLLTISDLAARWQVSYRQAKARWKAVSLPCSRIAGPPRFRIQDVEAAEARMAGKGGGK